MPNPAAGPIALWLSRLSHPKLFSVMALLFLVNLFIPDPLPFIDEILIGTVTLALANMKSARKDRNVIDVESKPQ